jgi:ribonuclease D
LAREAKAEAEAKEEGKGDTKQARRPEVVDEALTGAAEESIAPATAPAEANLVAALRAWRTQQAKSQGIPPYIVFANKVLETIAEQRPATLVELEKISGVGPAKLEQYGAAVIALINEFLDGNKKPGMVREEKESLQPWAELAPPPNWPDTFPDDWATSARNEPTVQNSKTAKENQIQNPPLARKAKSKIENPLEAILTIVSDLDGLLSPGGLASLLTAAPGEIVPFSDHELCGLFHNRLPLEAIEGHIQEAIQTKHLGLTPQQRLVSKQWTERRL